MVTRKWYWTKEECKYLQEHYQSKTYAEIGEKLGRGASSVGAKARELGLRKNGAMWSDTEIAFLVENYRKLTNAEIGKALGRSTGAVTIRVDILGLAKKHSPHREYELTPELERFLSALVYCYDVARERGAEKLDINAFIKEYRALTVNGAFDCA